MKLSLGMLNRKLSLTLNCTLSSSPLVLLMPVFALLGCASVPDTSNVKPDFISFVVLGENGVPVARVLTHAAQCPAIRFDGHDAPMDVRAAAGTVPLRATKSDPADSKPSAFPILACEKIVPTGTHTAVVDGRILPLPKSEATRIVVIGDTGCRLKKADDAFQPCNDADQYPFAKIAGLAAAWKPDLVVHVGDYQYRENACPEGNAGCAGSSWGYGWDTWRDDFFLPGASLLQAAPLVAVRGNHESCARAGQGWWRLLSPLPLLPQRDCNDASNDDIGDYSDPYAVPLGNGAQLILLDTSNTSGAPVPHGDIREIKYRDMYNKMDALSQKADYNIGANHQPILGFTAKQDAKGKLSVLPGNQGIQSVFGAINPLIMPPRINAMLSGHVHVWQEVSFSTPHPTQFVAGFSGTLEDVVPLPSTLPVGATPAPGAVVEHISSWVNGFGYMTMERKGARLWDVKVWDTSGHQVNRCSVEGSKSICEIAQVK
jgi:hypothetical protein